MLSRCAVVVIAAGFFSTFWTGCAGAPPAASIVSSAEAPTQSQRPDPNAPYVIPARPRPAAAHTAPTTAASPCSPDALKVEEISGNVHDNYHSIKLGFQNQTGVNCQLSGYPLVALFSGQGRSLGSIAEQRTTEAQVRAELAESAPGEVKATQSVPAAITTGEPQNVVLAPQAVAAFQVVWSAGDSCPRVARVLVTPPGTTRTFTVSQPMSVCMGRIQVTPLGLDQGDD